MAVEIVKEKGKAGRPKKVIDWDLVQKLAHIQCTQNEISAAVGVSVDTLHSHPEFTEAFKRGAEGGRKSLRRLQFESATKGNVVMQIWLGKQYLGQRDNLDQRVNTEIQVRADYSKLNDEELAQLERLTDKACARTIDVMPVALPAAPDEPVSTIDQTQQHEVPVVDPQSVTPPTAEAVQAEGGELYSPEEHVRPPMQTSNSPDQTRVADEE